MHEACSLYFWKDIGNLVFTLQTDASGHMMYTIIVRTAARNLVCSTSLIQTVWPVHQERYRKFDIYYKGL